MADCVCKASIQEAEAGGSGVILSYFVCVLARTVGARTHTLVFALAHTHLGHTTFDRQTVGNSRCRTDVDPHMGERIIETDVKSMEPVA